MGSFIGSIVLSTSDTVRAAEFWSGALGYITKPGKPEFLAPMEWTPPSTTGRDHGATHLQLDETTVSTLICGWTTATLWSRKSSACWPLALSVSIGSTPTTPRTWFWPIQTATSSASADSDRYRDSVPRLDTFNASSMVRSG